MTKDVLQMAIDALESCQRHAYGEEKFNFFAVGKSADALRAARETHVLVPIEPTREMADAGLLTQGQHYSKTYKAMIKAYQGE